MEKINVFHGVFLLSPPWVACERQHLLGFVISQWMSECPADSSPIPFPAAPSPRCHMCAFWSMSYSRSDVFGQMSGHILILFIGEEGWSLVPGEAGGIEFIVIVMCQTKADKKEPGFLWRLMSQSDLFPDFGRLKLGQLYIVFISFYWVTIVSCKKQ